MRAMLVNIEAVAKSTAEMTKSPEMKLEMPAIYNAPTKMSLLKLFMLFLYLTCAITSSLCRFSLIAAHYTG